MVSEAKTKRKPPKDQPPYRETDIILKKIISKPLCKSRDKFFVK